MLAIDQSGNKLLEFIKITEEDAALQFSPITVCLLVVKISKDYLMGFNHWRKGWEIFGGWCQSGVIHQFHIKKSLFFKENPLHLTKL